jgi:acetyl-CoA carboxylase alpha subunit
VPTVSIILGQGTGGAALALAPADRVLVARHGWLAPLPPEGASMIRYGDTSHAQQMATDQRVRSADLLADHIADEIIDEIDQADQEPAAFSRRVGEALIRSLDELSTVPAAQRQEDRIARYSAIGIEHAG